MQQPHIMPVESVQPGDVIFFYEPFVADEFGAKTGFKYSHVGIGLGEGYFADAAAGGIEKTAIQTGVEEYSHAAVFRRIDGWDREAISRLHRFVDDAISMKKPFNLIGMGRWEQRRKEHESNFMSKVEGYFAGTVKPPDSNRRCYFCSEFVASIFIDVGFVHPSAAVLFDPAITSPAQLRDGVYGFFSGYLVPYSGYEIPENDDFRRETPLHEILAQG
jgi:hypothetical protein